MNKKYYKKRPGDFEIRILSNGKTILIAPDQDLMEIAYKLECKKESNNRNREAGENARK